MAMFLATHETDDGRAVSLLRVDQREHGKVWVYTDGDGSEIHTVKELPKRGQQWGVQLSYTNAVVGGYHKLHTSVDRCDVVAQVQEYVNMVHREGDVRADATITVWRPSKRAHE